MDAVFIDFAKAFDKVPHIRVIMKLMNLKRNNKIIAWITTFLTNRSQSAYVNGQISSLSHVKSGVPQGSVFGPILLLMYINDIGDGLICTIKLFADDWIIYRNIDSTTFNDIIQFHLNKLALWRHQ